MVVSEVGDGLSPGFLDRLGDDGGAGLGGAGDEGGDIGGNQGDLDAEGRFVRGGGDDFVREIGVGQFEAGEGEAGGSGFELAVGFAVVIVEEALGQAEGLLVEGEGGGDVFDLEDDVTERWGWGGGHGGLLGRRGGAAGCEQQCDG